MWKKPSEHYEILGRDARVDVQWLDEHEALEENGILARNVDWARVRLWRPHEPEPAEAQFTDLDHERGCQAVKIMRAASHLGDIHDLDTLGAHAARLARIGWEPPVDPKLVMARKVVADTWREIASKDTGNKARSLQYAEECLRGEHDKLTPVLAIMAVLQNIQLSPN